MSNTQLHALDEQGRLLPVQGTNNGYDMVNIGGGGGGGGGLSVLQTTQAVRDALFATPGGAVGPGSIAELLTLGNTAALAHYASYLLQATGFGEDGAGNEWLTRENAGTTEYKQFGAGAWQTAQPSGFSVKGGAAGASVSSGTVGLATDGELYLHTLQADGVTDQWRQLGTTPQLTVIPAGWSPLSTSTGADFEIIVKQYVRSVIADSAPQSVTAGDTIIKEMVYKVAAGTTDITAGELLDTRYLDTAGVENLAITDDANLQDVTTSTDETDPLDVELMQIQTSGADHDLYNLVIVGRDNKGNKVVIVKGGVHDGKVLTGVNDADLFGLLHWSKVIPAQGGGGGSEANVMQFRPVAGMTPVIEIEAIGGDIPAGAFTVRGVRIGGTTVSASNAAIIPTGQTNVAVIDFGDMPEAVGYSIDVDNAIAQFRVSVGFKPYTAAENETDWTTSTPTSIGLTAGNPVVLDAANPSRKALLLASPPTSALYLNYGPTDPTALLHDRKLEPGDDWGIDRPVEVRVLSEVDQTIIKSVRS